MVDPVSRSQGPPQSIADTLGVPSPIDAAFTRCNCHGTVYIIKVPSGGSTLAAFLGHCFLTKYLIDFVLHRGPKYTYTAGQIWPTGQSLTPDTLLLSLGQGEQCWRLDENLLREPGSPKPLASEFPGLSGNVTAALPFPATGGSPETVFFFRNGRYAVEGSILLRDIGTICWSSAANSQESI